MRIQRDWWQMFIGKRRCTLSRFLSFFNSIVLNNAWNCVKNGNLKGKKWSVETFQCWGKKRNQFLGISCFNAFSVMKGSKEKKIQHKNMKLLNCLNCLNCWGWGASRNQIFVMCKMGTVHLFCNMTLDCFSIIQNKIFICFFPLDIWSPNLV